MTTTADAVTTAAVDSVSHLTPERWADANRHLVRKAIAEFSHERILVPELIREEGAGVGLYKVVSDDDATEYRFRARSCSSSTGPFPRNSIARLRGRRGIAGGRTGLHRRIPRGTGHPPGNAARVS